MERLLDWYRANHPALSPGWTHTKIVDSRPIPPARVYVAAKRRRLLGLALRKKKASVKCTDFERRTDDAGRDLLNGVAGSIQQLPTRKEATDGPGV